MRMDIDSHVATVAIKGISIMPSSDNVSVSLFVIIAACDDKNEIKPCKNIKQRGKEHRRRAAWRPFRPG